MSFKYRCLMNIHKFQTAVESNQSNLFSLHDHKYCFIQWEVLIYVLFIIKITCFRDSFHNYSLLTKPHTNTNIHMYTNTRIHSHSHTHIRMFTRTWTVWILRQFAGNKNMILTYVYLSYDIKSNRKAHLDL